MSQILRLAGRMTMKNAEISNLCEACICQRNGYREFSTKTKFDPHARFFMKRWKKRQKALPNRADLQEELSRMLDARCIQLSSSAGKRTQLLEQEMAPSKLAEYQYWKTANQSSRLVPETLNTGYTQARNQKEMEDRLGNRDHVNSEDQTSLEEFYESRYKNGDKIFSNQTHIDRLDIERTKTKDTLQYLNNLETDNETILTIKADRLPNSPEESIALKKPKHENKTRKSTSDILSNFENKTVFADQLQNLKTDFKVDNVRNVNLQEFQKKSGIGQMPMSRAKVKVDIKDEIKDIIQQHKTAKDSSKVGTKKKHMKAALNEIYERKNSKIQEKKETLKLKQEKLDKKSVFDKIHRKSLVSDLIVNDYFRETLDDAKKMFTWKGDPQPTRDSKLYESSENLVDLFFEKRDMRAGSSGRDLFKEPATEDSNETKAAQDQDEEGEEDFDKLDLPEAEWEILKSFRKKKRKLPTTMSLSEHERLEMLQDPYHKDTTVAGDMLMEEVAAAEWMTDEPGSIQGYLTDKAKEKQKERNKQKVLLAEEVNWDLVEQAQLEIFNVDLKNYVEACIYGGMTMRALNDVKMYRKRNIPEEKITDVTIYNMLLRGLGKENRSLDLVREVFSYIREDGLTPTYETYSICLSCIGKTGDYDLMIASFIVKDMVKQGLDVRNIFNQCTFQYNERHCVYKMLSKIIPNYEPYPPNVDVTYTGPLVEPLNEMLPDYEKVETNPLTCGMTKDQLMQAAEEQFRKELDGFVTIDSVFRTNTKIDTQKREMIDAMRDHWRKKIKEAFLTQRSKLLKKAYAEEGMNMYPFFCLFPVDDYVWILCKEVEWWSQFTHMYSPTAQYLKRCLANRIQKRFTIQQMIDTDVFPKLHKAYSAYISRLTDPNTPVHNQRECWKQIIQRFSDGNSMEIPAVNWSSSIRSTIGEMLFQLLLENAEVNVNIFTDKPERFNRAFYCVERARDGKKYQEVKPHIKVLMLMTEQADIVMPIDKVPSLCPPVPYTAPCQGGNFINSEGSVRWCLKRQVDMFEDKTEEAGPVLDSLNILSSYGWKINQPVLEVVLKVFREGGNMKLDIPVLPDNIPKPQKPDQSAPSTDHSEYNKKSILYKKHYGEATSLWWSALYKLSIAQQLQDRTFWLPVNMDFRGRTYPVAPHLNHQGQDFVRSLMLFSKGKPLGQRGFDWLKLHLINLTELKKKSSLRDRLAFADEVMPEILDSADAPLTGRKWWMTSENPWQTLAACMEVANAVRSGDPSLYISQYPVHQDGSCNGLQHYAAMGRDVTGARSVNLQSATDTPADVYSDVVDLVMKEIESDIADNTDNARIAQVCKPYLDRKVIKQSIMTTVYGVTMYGAKLQIQRQLEYKNFPEKHMINACVYLTQKTFQCLNNLFTSARQIQNWFDRCSVAISRTGRSVEWETPLKFPCIQPYFKDKPIPRDMPFKVYNYLLHEKQVFRTANSSKQKNGFAPNFVHSLDSVHMMLTSLYCYRKGLTYSSVHDSFWTHACDVDIMSQITREQFIALHSQPILQDLSKYFIERYINSEELTLDQQNALREVFTAVPKTGEFDLSEILKSQYFFS